jgi:hypothetical protein
MSTADEFYEFKGDPDFGKSPYRVARHGTTVTEQVDVRDPRVRRYDSVEVARAEFADATCDPNGPAAPMPGDEIRIVWGPEEGETFAVESVVTRGVEFGVTGNRSRRPLVLVFGQYRIVSRPVA